MLCWILIIGGLLIMMGQHDRCEALFYYFRLDDQVPESHLLRLIDKHISFGGVPFRLPRRSPLNSSCGSRNCSCRQRCMLRQPYSAPGASKTGIGAMSQNGFWRSGASP